MEELTTTRAPATDAVLALLGGCNSLTDGVGLAHQVLDLTVTGYHLAEAHLVLRPASMAPQIFARGRGPVTPELASDLAERPSGLYTSPDAVPIGVRRAIAGCCEMALAAHALRLKTGQAATGLPLRSAMEDAVRRAASRASRFRWPSTLILLRTAGPGPAESRWQALAAAMRATNRACDEVGVAGRGHVAAILADAAQEDVETYVGRLRAALDRDGAGDVRLVIGAASTPSESVNPDELWKLCEQRTAEAAPTEDGFSGAIGPLVASELEMELRCLPDVVSVGLTGLDERESGVRSVTVVARRHNEALHREVAALAAAAGLGDVPLAILAAGTSTVPLNGSAVEPTDRAVTVSGNGGPALAVGGGSHEAQSVGGNQERSPMSGERRDVPPVTDPDGTPSRVVLLLSEFDRSTGASEVSLAWRGTTAVGQAVGTPLAGAAQATLSAVEALGASVPDYLTSVERASIDKRTSVVVVTLSARPTGVSTAVDRRFGVAQGGDETTAASRATLAALNRLLTATPGIR